MTVECFVCERVRACENVNGVSICHRCLCIVRPDIVERQAARQPR